MWYLFMLCLCVHMYIMCVVYNGVYSMHASVCVVIFVVYVERVM